MPRFFVKASQIGVRDDGSKTVLIIGDDAAHITRSLRMKPGESVCVCDMARREYDCSVLSVGEEVLLSVLSERESDTEPPFFATLYQALVKGDKFDTVVQKAVECGASRIVPFISDRCVVRLTKKDCEKKRLRWQRIAAEAAKQCGRGIIPSVEPLLTFGEAVAEAAKADIPLLCYEGEEGVTLPGVLRERKDARTVSILIGSEGGFAASEADSAKEAGLISVGLGKRILRTETASGFALACISYELEL
ncbi:MAG: 16S rRNA (uracil(1498)-N(3))-methyltransferase [Ruminococcaceae bacterium]|nr:16S rRNA (uracil(1498)-N(3))-methyltransferase [Oscillospiraceae bacterium]